MRNGHQPFIVLGAICLALSFAPSAHADCSKAEEAVDRCEEKQESKLDRCTSGCERQSERCEEKEERKRNRDSSRCEEAYAACEEKCDRTSAKGCKRAKKKLEKCEKRAGRDGNRRGGKLKTGSGAVRGRCDKNSVRDGVRRRANSLRACYEQRLQSNPELGGKVTVQWSIGPTGRVLQSKVISNTTKDASLASCIRAVTQRMVFRRPKDGGICVVSWPFVFQGR